MPKIKIDFKLENNRCQLTESEIRIVGQAPVNKPYVSISVPNTPECLFIPDKHLELFAVNILKALKSKHLKKL
jgi:hypothetical protein